MNKSKLLLLSLLTICSIAKATNSTLFTTDTTKVATDTIKTPADTSYWIFKGNASLSLSQINLTNWVAGGENSYTLNSGIDFSASYKKDKNSWDNSVILGFGFLRKETEKKRMNTADKIDLSTKYGRSASNKWYYSALLGFRTQFDQGFKTVMDSLKISDFMSPAYVTLSLGMDYKENGKLTVLLSPVASKLTLVQSPYLNRLGAFGVDSGKVARLEMGGNVKFGYNATFWDKRVNLKNTIELFSNYMEKPQNIDLNWDLTVDIKISNYITFKFQLLTIYDDDSKIAIKDAEGNVIKSVAKIQVKEFLGFGLAYNFDSSKSKES